jgi:uncharacterized protein (TIGR02246 family)
MGTAAHMHAYHPRPEHVRTALVSQLPHRFAWAWNVHDMEAAFADFDDDAEFVDAHGVRWFGFEEIVAHHEALHATDFARTELTIDEVRLRLITVDSAYVKADWTLRGHADGPCRGTLLFVVARQGSSWRVFAAQSTERRD